MKMLHEKCELNINLIENHPTCLIIEDQHTYSDVIADLWNQINGGDGGWILSERESLLQINKMVELIVNPVSLNCNDKKVINKLYHEIKEVVNEKYEVEFATLNTDIIDFLEKVTLDCPYPIALNVDTDIHALLKLYDVKIETMDVSILEKIVNYLRTLHQVCNVEIFIFVGLKGYLTHTELLELYTMASYEKLHIILIESFMHKPETIENTIILDSDLCIIQVPASEC